MKKLIFFYGLMLFLPSITFAAQFQSLGFPPGGESYSKAQDISADGQTIVGIAQGAYWIPAFIWTEANGMQVFGDPIPGLPPPWDQYTLSTAESISADGSTVLGTNSFSFSQMNTPVIWSQQSGYITLPLDHNSLRDISSTGEFVAASHNTGVGTEAVRWSAAGGIELLGSLTQPGFSPKSHAEAISADGSVLVGYSQVDGSLDYAGFYWTGNGGMINIGRVPGEKDTRATAVTANGTVVAGKSGSHLFRWTAANGIISLGELDLGPNVPTWVHASDISNDGATIVGSGHGFIGGGQVLRQAIVWTEADEIRTLEDILVNEYGIDLQGWKLTDATGVSANGLVITGYGTNPSGQTESWRVVLDY